VATVCEQYITFLKINCIENFQSANYTLRVFHRLGIEKKTFEKDLFMRVIYIHGMTLIIMYVYLMCVCGWSLDIRCADIVLTNTDTGYLTLYRYKYFCPDK